jgi:hypothetical protein
MLPDDGGEDLYFNSTLTLASNLTSDLSHSTSNVHTSPNVAHPFFVWGPLPWLLNAYVTGGDSVAV